MPAAVERCVQDLLKDSKFRPNQKGKTRESSAWAICQAAQKNKKKHSEADIYNTLFDLPDSVGITIDENGEFELFDIPEIEQMEFEAAEASDGEDSYDLFFDENGMDDDGLKGFSILSEIHLANKKKKDDETECEDGKCATTSLELLRSGSWAHPWYGTINFDKKYFMSCVQNFANNVLHRDISFDAQHMPWFGAVAWVTKLNMRLRKFFDGKRRWVLTADVEFTKDGEDMIRQKRFKYFSSEVHDNYKEQELSEENKDSKEPKLKAFGPTLMGGGVTNRPYISGMLAVELSEDAVFRTSSTEPGVDGTTTLTFSESHGDKEVSDAEIEELIIQLDKVIKEEKIDLAEEEKARPPDSKLPDASFALIKKDRTGNVVKRSLSHHNSNVKSLAENGSVDIGRLRNALARVDQVKGFTPAEISKAKSHLLAHVKELLKTHKKEKAAAKVASEPTTQEGVDSMDFEQMIKDVQTKLDALDDKDSELAKAYSEQIATIKTAQEKFEADQKRFADDQTKKFEEQQKKIDEQTKALDDQRKKFEEMEQRWAVADEERRQAQVKLFCETLEKEDHLPATIEVVKKFMFADVESFTMKFTEGDKEVSFNLEKIFKEILDTIPKDRRVKKSEVLKGEGDDTPVVNSGNSKVQLSDTDEPVDVMDPKRRTRALKKAGYKVKGADDVQ